MTKTTLARGLASTVLSSALSVSTFAQAQPQQPQQQRVDRHAIRQAEDQKDLGHRSVGQLIQNIELNAAVSVDLSILKGLDTGFKYTYNVEPAYQAGLYTRIDRWTPKIKVHIPKVMTSIEPGAEVIYLRQFPNQAQAVKAVPRFDLNKIPLTAANALNLDPGDVVMLPVFLNVMIGPDVGTNAGPIEFFARGQYVMRGAYQIQALRLADQRVRLRLVATRQKGIEAETGARLNIEIFEFNPLNKIAEAIVGKRLGSVGFGKGPKGLVMADYIFDLSNPDARDAYDRLLSSDRLLTNFKLVNPLVGEKELQSMFVADLGGVDRIAETDSTKPADQRRIMQIFKGRSTGETETFGLKANLLRIFTFDRSTSLSQDNHVVFLDSENETQDFLAPSHKREKRTKFWFGIRDEESLRKASIITPVDANGVPAKMGEFVVSLEMKDKHMGQGETERVLQNLRRNVAPSIIEKLNIEPLLTATSYTNARVYAQIIFNERAINDLQGITKAHLVQAFEKHLLEVRTQLGDKNPASWVQGHNYEIWSLSDQLVNALNPKYALRDRIRLFMDVQKNGFFREIGTGVLMSLFRPERLDQLLSVYIRVDATAFKAPIEANFGTSEFRSVVKVTEYIEHMLDQGSFDLRLETFGTTSGQVISLKQIGAAVPTGK